jgi:hypothetical protein
LFREKLMVVAALPAGAMAARHTLSAIAQAVKALYGFASDVNEGINQLIQEMKDSENPTTSRTGRVIEAAKFGFGIGYTVPVAIIAVGQLLLGNTFAAGWTVFTTVTLTNPVAMTCAAVGAIYYGWGALSDVERNEILDKLSKGLAIGVELIKSIIAFVIKTTEDLLSAKNFSELKQVIGTAAAQFGKTLGDVTKKIADVVGDALDSLKRTSGDAVDGIKRKFEKKANPSKATPDAAAKPRTKAPRKAPAKAARKTAQGAEPKAAPKPRAKKPKPDSK